MCTQISVGHRCYLCLARVFRQVNGDIKVSVDAVPGCNAFNWNLILMYGKRTLKMRAWYEFQCTVCAYTAAKIWWMCLYEFAHSPDDVLLRNNFSFKSQGCVFIAKAFFFSPAWRVIGGECQKCARFEICTCQTDSHLQGYFYLFCQISRIWQNFFWRGAKMCSSGF